MKLCSLSSSSSGNSTYIEAGGTRLLVDVGITNKRICEELADLDVDPSTIDGVLITHDHSDHTKGVRVFASKHPCPVYATPGTIRRMRRMSTLGDLSQVEFREIDPDEDIVIGDIRVHATRTWHDAAEPVCYQFYYEEKKVSIVTDLGDYTDYLVEALSGSDLLLVESNHDRNMLLVGPYTYDLKQRILSDHGHLSNERCGDLVMEIISPRTKGILLGHLSKENNMPELAFETTYQRLCKNIYGLPAEHFHLAVAPRDEHSQVYDTED